MELYVDESGQISNLTSTTSVVVFFQLVAESSRSGASFGTWEEHHIIPAATARPRLSKAISQPSSPVCYVADISGVLYHLSLTRILLRFWPSTALDLWPCPAKRVSSSCQRRHAAPRHAALQPSQHHIVTTTNIPTFERVNDLFTSFQRAYIGSAAKDRQTPICVQTSLATISAVRLSLDQAAVVLGICSMPLTGATWT